MRWSFRILTVAGIGIYLHITFLLLVGFLASRFFQQGGGSYAVHGTALILSIFGCVLLHELGHALTARRFGVRTKDIILLPIGGVARLERIPTEPMQELLIAIAGPAVNVVIVLLLGAAIYSLKIDLELSTEDIIKPRVGLDVYLVQLLDLNVILVLFNLVPAFPMDGGRILRSTLAFFMDHGKATRIAAGVGQSLAIVFGLYGLGIPTGQIQPMLVLLAVFVFLGASGEAAQAQIQTVFRGLPVTKGMFSDFKTLSPREDLGRAVDLLLSGSQVDFPVLDDGTVKGILTRQQLVQSLREFGPAKLLGEIPLVTVEPIEADLPLYRAYEEMGKQQAACLPVARGGAIVGWITRENLAEVAMVRQALGGRETR